MCIKKNDFPSIRRSYDYTIEATFNGKTFNLVCKYVNTTLLLSATCRFVRQGSSSKYDVTLSPNVASNGTSDIASIHSMVYDSARNQVTGSFQSSGVNPVSYKSDVGEYLLTLKK